MSQIIKTLRRLYWHIHYGVGEREWEEKGEGEGRGEGRVQLVGEDELNQWVEGGGV